MKPNDTVAGAEAVPAAGSAGRRKPRGAVAKISTTIRFDADVLAHFRQSGPGWQSRMNAALRDWIAAAGR